MSSNYYRSGGCSGCGRSRSNFDSCGCQSSNNGRLNCFRGPFRAVDASCIIPPASTGAIIPFASGIVPVVLASIGGGLVDTGAIVGFGTAIPAIPITLTGTTIDLTTLGVINEAFSVPRTGTLTAISASFTATAALALTGTATVNAEIYRAPAGSNIFTATGVSVDLAPPITGLGVAVGDTFSGTASNFSVPVAAGDRLLMVFTLRSSGVIATFTGTVSAGLNIE